MFECEFSVYWDKAGVYLNIISKDGIILKSFFSAKPLGLYTSSTDCRNGEVLKLERDLRKYFRGEWVEFNRDLKKRILHSIGKEMGEFAAKVLKEVSEIPYGVTRTYGEIAKKLKTSPRAVGQAVKRNPVAVIIPCHRAVGQKSIGGYSSTSLSLHDALRIKRLLLEVEGVRF